MDIDYSMLFTHNYIREAVAPVLSKKYQKYGIYGAGSDVARTKCRTDGFYMLLEQ